MVQFAKYQENTFSDAQKARSHETKGFDLVVPCQKCNPRLNQAETCHNGNNIPYYNLLSARQKTPFFLKTGTIPDGFFLRFSSFSG